ncbi:unnamed protein product [Brassicogethes aeneus]|uniref:RecA family profile 1 domain-containing protein n=1 Tax=Brassicogethes aeneus TaxID=1431903 RepID=A0A9P0B765_BRAAE|nr:unnamed protein product [Brassicogethes aeneus]
MKRLQKVITKEDYEKITLANISSLEELIENSVEELNLQTNLPYESLKDIVIKASKIFGPKIISAFDVPEWEKLSTGSPEIDLITNGGMSFEGINEISGCSGVGKTQFCLQLSIMCQLPEILGGKYRGVVYLNTDKLFPSTRFRELTTNVKDKYPRLDLDLESNVFLQHISSYGQLKRTLYTSLPIFLSLNDVGLLIIDSIAGIFRSDNEDVVYSQRSQQFVKIATQLNNLSTKFNVCVVCVNQVTDNPITEETVPCLGLSWSNLVNSRFHITRFQESSIRKFENIFGPHLPNSSCNFTINSDGIS